MSKSVTQSRPDVSDTPLRIEGLTKRFGGITAVDGASFEVERGTLTGLIGPNGAGKSTTFNLITGMLSPDAGTITFDGDDITGDEPYDIANRGLVRTFQIARELGEMTVLENMMLAPKGQRGEHLWRSVLPGVRGSVRRQEAELLDRVWETLEFFDIEHLAEEYAGNLSGGQRKLLEMARALLTDPDMLAGESTPRTHPRPPRPGVHVPPGRTRHGPHHEQLSARDRDAPREDSDRRDARGDQIERGGHRGVSGG